MCGWQFDGWRENTLRGAGNVEVTNGSTVSNKTYDRALGGPPLIPQLIAIFDGCLHPCIASGGSVAKVVFTLYLTGI